MCSSVAELMMLRLQCKTLISHTHVLKAKLILRQACRRINLLSKSACCVWGAWLKSDARCRNMAPLRKHCICDSDRHLILGRKKQERPYESALCKLKATRNHDCKGLLLAAASTKSEQTLPQKRTDLHCEVGDLKKGLHKHPRREGMV